MSTEPLSRNNQIKAVAEVFDVLAVMLDGIARSCRQQAALLRLVLEPEDEEGW